MIFCVALLKAQKNEWTFDKLKQKYQINRFYNEVFKNPALMSGFGKYNFSEFKTMYSNIEEEANLIQKPNQQNSFGLLASSFYPADSTTTLWGKAGYVNSNQKDIVWNESIDYDLIYPYFTADSVGGNLKNESYNFLGGYAKSFKKIDFGAQMSYDATLASRAKDPRIRNISSNLKLKLGMNFKNVLGENLGFYGAYQKYTQSNSISFFSEISSPAVYHLNGLGYFNNLLRGTNLEAFYDGFGYGFGAVSSPFKKKDLWITADFRKLTIGKFLVETLSTQISNLKNQDFNIAVTKVFNTKNNTFGVKFNYDNNSKTGVESVISARSGIGLAVLAQNENYNLKNTVYKLSGIFYRDKKNDVFIVAPYVSYQDYNEDYFLIRSFQYFRYLEKGVQSNYIRDLGTASFISSKIHLSYRSVLDQQALLRNDNEASLSSMISNNNMLLSSNAFNFKLGAEFSHNIKKDLNLFFSIDSDLTNINSVLNNSILFSTGLRF